ncbi:MAG: hypothetical protein ACP5GS_01585 [Nitrososphaeria archaeon]
MKKKGQAEIIGALFFIIILVMAFATFYYMYYDFSSFAYLENQKIQQEHIAQAQILVENYSIQAQNVQFNVSSTNSLSSSPYLYKLDGIAPVTLNVSTAKINITVPIKAKSYTLNLYGYSKNPNVTNLFIYAKNSSGVYVLIGGYIISNGPFQLNIPFTSNFIVKNLVQLKINSSQIATYAAGSIVSTNDYIVVTIFNQQNVNTPAPFQQEINLSKTSQIAQLVEPNASNVEFSYLNGTLIPSWFEGKDSHGDYIWWIKLDDGIPADSMINIKMIIGPWNVNYYAENPNVVGEAPQLSSNYGEYDSGQNVFNFYDNFGGSSINSGKWNANGNGTVQVNDGLTIKCSNNNYSIVYSKANFGYGNVVEFFGNLGALTESIKSKSQNMSIGLGASNITPSYVIFSSVLPSSSTPINLEVSSNPSLYGYNSGLYIWQLELIDNNVIGFQNYSSKHSISDTALSNFDEPIVFYCYNGKSGKSLTLGPFYWVRVRAAPPNGVMPKVIFGYLLTTMIGTHYIENSMQNFAFSKIAITSFLSLPSMNYTTYYPTTTSYYLNNWQGKSFSFTYNHIIPASSNISLWLDIYNNGSSADTINVQMPGLSKTILIPYKQENRVCISVPANAMSDGSLTVTVTASQNTIIDEAILQAIVPHVIVVNDGSYPITIIRIWNNSNPPKYFNVSITLMPGQQVDLSNYFVQGSNIIKVVSSDGNYYSFYY